MPQKNSFFAEVYNDKSLDSDKKKKKEKDMCETTRSSSMLLDL